MAFYRLFTGPDGQSHMEEYKPPNEMPATGLVFRKHEPGNFIDWHTAPPKLFLFTLAGHVYLGFCYVTVYRFCPGVLILSSAFVGPFHTSCAVS